MDLGWITCCEVDGNCSTYGLAVQEYLSRAKLVMLEDVVEERLFKQ